MSKKIYIGVNGAAKEVDPLYVSVGGSTKKISKVYVGVDGVAKQAYPETVTHKWNRYNVNTTYYWDRYECIFTFFWDVNEFDGSLMGGPSRTHFKSQCSGEVATDYHFATPGRYGGRAMIAFDPDEVIPFSTNLSGTYYCGWYSGSQFRCDNSGTVLAALTIGSGSRINAQILYTQSNSSLSSYGVRIGSKIGRVSSNDSTTYPDYDSLADVPGGEIYYYRRDNSSTEYSKGSYDGSVNSSNRNAYPDNGRDGSYWYVYDRSTKTQGSANGSVTSTNRGEYPDNGVSGSYWYVYAGTV